MILRFLIIPSLFLYYSHAWTSHPSSLHQSPSRWMQHSPRRLLGGGQLLRSSTKLLAGLPENFQEFGEAVIRKAGASCGITKDDDLTIDWKAGRIIVTVHGTVYVSAGKEETTGEEEEEEKDTEMSKGGNENENTNGDTDSTKPITSTGVDVTALARAINAGLDDDGLGFAIAEVHEIEVTTPGAPDELQGVMWEAYKGFDVICEQQDSKTKKIKQIDGRLVERNDEFTILNIKGRMKKMKNNTVLSVKLPKAKKEKGVK